ncbi:hypothetical protein [Streptomyces sp. NPDC006879]|uniref:hypothetical protein n=1 Tax=Streptomyces sp. NPDC006879 TaxID=3364767 RepID=UPI00367695DE
MFTLGGPAEVGLFPHTGEGRPAQATVILTVGGAGTGQRPTLGGAGGSQESGGPDAPGPAVFTLDFAPLAQIAEVKLKPSPDSDCVTAATSAVCTLENLHHERRTIAELTLSAAGGSRPGASGRLTVTGAGPGARFTPYSGLITVGGPDLVLSELALKSELVPGERQAVDLTFANTGTAPAQGALLELRTTRGLSWVQLNSNCSYREPGGGSPGSLAWAVAWCTFPGPFEPGHRYALAGPLTLLATQRAFNDSLVYRIAEDTPQHRAVVRAGGGFTRGSAGTLGLKPHATERPEAEPGDGRTAQQHEAGFHTANSADLVALPASLRGSVGQQVRADLGFRNDGPAWLTGPGTAVSVDVRVPPGTRVLAVPAGCGARTADGAARTEQLGAPRYACRAPQVISEGERVSFPFDLVVDRFVAGATGSVQVGAKAPGGGTRPLAFDPAPGNNTAVHVLNRPQPSGAAGGGGGRVAVSGGAPSTPAATAPAAVTTRPTASTAAEADAGQGVDELVQGTRGGLALSAVRRGLITAGASCALAAAAAILLALRTRRPNGWGRERRRVGPRGRGPGRTRQ